MDKKLHQQASEILAKVLELPKNKALEYIKDACRNNEFLYNEVIGLYNEFTEVNINTNNTVKKKEVKQHFIFTNKQADKSSFINTLRVRLFTKKRSRLLLICTVLICLLGLGYSLRQEVYSTIIASELEEKIAQNETTAVILNDWVSTEKDKLERFAKTEIIRNLGKKLEQLEKKNLSIKEYNKVVIPLSDQILRIQDVYQMEAIGIISKNTPKVLLNSYHAKQGFASDFNFEQLGDAFYTPHIKAKSGETIFIPPIHNSESLFSKTILYKDADCIFLTPITDTNGNVLCILYSATFAKGKFSKLFIPSQHGHSSETYAIDNDFQMISKTRFNDQLKNTILIPNTPDATSIFYINIKNPGENIMAGNTPALPTSEWPLTESAKAIKRHLDQPSSYKNSGVIDHVYKNYQGVAVIGAWKWLDNLGFGIISEEYAEDSLDIIPKLDLLFIILYIIIAGLLFVLYNSNITLLRYNKKINQLHQLGQYKLLDKIGEGGFGEVYKAEHVLLKMPVAIKLLKKEISNDDSIMRFEKEVKITSSLKHPNTIKVYDFGRSPEGNFYYVMEYIKGITLSKALEIQQPFPLERVIHVLLQVCYSLQEAHKNNLVHRDLKPLNILLSQQGGAYDQVKLLDFGLVKNLENQDEEVTQMHKIGGTPMFMAPERLRDPLNSDTKVDIYALGALGLYMLSGKFLVELISQKVMSGEETIQGNFRDMLIDRNDVPDDLKEILLKCIRFDPSKRLQTVDTLIAVLEVQNKLHPWNREDAKAWWKTYDVY
ncbi:serine/threonine-protein kinase [Flammeovirga kamogawensis]|uniref:Serine/threonine protein kinase n=1 Tax=Flammeovirga kamogawensis TaxID=373891 RepID=A0ABX8H272_9BACT|nr:serine/threonine-protein kinase [Flammeovirga kamogawensis]MBB6462187.1 tRNA A-37 threonylcarbamoyl transferase component Bud32 [Flammeovirga kamogawensis]QWG09412.1 serine/threonine protein kinase [Flammeovirga kamogawensis]TRX64930.1 serine/threonine protein kinase [Flammeovirga kamogawensis]